MKPCHWVRNHRHHRTPCSFCSISSPFSSSFCQISSSLRPPRSLAHSGGRKRLSLRHSIYIQSFHSESFKPLLFLALLLNNIRSIEPLHAIDLVIFSVRLCSIWQINSCPSISVLTINPLPLFELIPSCVYKTKSPLTVHLDCSLQDSFHATGCSSFHHHWVWFTSVYPFCFSLDFAWPLSPIFLLLCVECCSHNRFPRVSKISSLT